MRANLSLDYEHGSVTQKPALTLEPERLETLEVALERPVRPTAAVKSTARTS